MKNYVEGIKDAIDQMEKPLERLVTEAKNVSEKVISRENFLNTQFSRQLEDLHESQVWPYTIKRNKANWKLLNNWVIISVGRKNYPS